MGALGVHTLLRGVLGYGARPAGWAGRLRLTPEMVNVVVSVDESLTQETVQ